MPANTGLNSFHRMALTSATSRRIGATLNRVRPSRLSTACSPRSITRETPPVLRSRWKRRLSACSRSRVASAVLRTALCTTGEKTTSRTSPHACPPRSAPGRRRRPGPGARRSARRGRGGASASTARFSTSGTATLNSLASTTSARAAHPLAPASPARLSATGGGPSAPSERICSPKSPQARARRSDRWWKPPPSASRRRLGGRTARPGARRRRRGSGRSSSGTSSQDLGPLLPPGERAAAGGAGLGRQVGLLPHAAHLQGRPAPPPAPRSRRSGCVRRGRKSGP